jgi:MFS transporter, ACDE family, multidrug resistance protein
VAGWHRTRQASWWSAVLVAAVVLSTVHEALDAADRGEVRQPELDDLDRAEREDAVQIAAGLGSVD